MENKDQENKVNQDPKPTDQVQLEIETVTPDTEKDVVPTTNSDQLANETANTDKLKEEKNNGVADKANQSSEAETSPKVESEELPGDMEGKSAEVETVVHDKAKAETSTDDNDDAYATKKDDGENDERDQIETISP